MPSPSEHTVEVMTYAAFTDAGSGTATRLVQDAR